MISSLFLVWLTLATTQDSCCEATLKKLTREAKLVVVAQVVEVKPTGLPFEIWSGPVLSTQKVRFKVKEVLKGDLVGSDITVSYSLVYKTKTADGKHARLSPKLFADGKVLVLFLKEEGGQKVSLSTDEYMSIDPNCGAVEQNPNTLKIIRKTTAVASPKH